MKNSQILGQSIFFNYIMNRKNPKTQEAKWLLQYINGLYTSLYQETPNIVIVSEKTFYDKVFHSLENRGVVINCEGSKAKSGLIGNVNGQLYYDNQLNALHMKTLFKDKESPYYMAFSYPDNDIDDMYLNAITEKDISEVVEELNNDIDLDDTEANYTYASIENELTISSLLENILYEQKKEELLNLIEKSILENDKKAFLSHTKALNSLEKPACLYQVLK